MGKLSVNSYAITTIAVKVKYHSARAFAPHTFLARALSPTCGSDRAPWNTPPVGWQTAATGLPELLKGL